MLRLLRILLLYRAGLIAGVLWGLLSVVVLRHALSCEDSYRSASQACAIYRDVFPGLVFAPLLVSGLASHVLALGQTMLEPIVSILLFGSLGWLLEGVVKSGARGSTRSG
jgi:hypothetical protein